MLRRRRLLVLGVLLPMTLTFVMFSVQLKRSAKRATFERPDYTPEGPLEKLRVVHLDLKGAPPRMHFLKALFRMISTAGANALLVEYEDMFPFEGILKNASAGNAYSREEILQMLGYAHESRLEVIPLVQTFGHLEFILKLPEFRHFRELFAFPQEICPSNPDTFRVLVRELIRLLFSEHVARVAQFVRAEFSGVTPLMWDDMLRHWSPKDLADSGLGELVEPVVWVYSEDIMRLLPQYIWYMYGRAFPHIWVASAFKGAYGETAVAPNLQRHAENNLAWLRIVQTTKGVPFRGMVLTGWARYDHFAVLCELLPVSVPSLLLNLLLVLHPHWPKSQVIRLWMQALSCPPGLAADKSLDSDPFQWHLGTCAFPGSNLFSAVGSYVSLQARVSALYTDVTQRHGWLTTYNVRHNFSSPWRLLEVHAIVQQLLRELTTFRNSTAHIMTQYFDQFVVDEWLEQKVDPLAEKMTSLKHFVQSLVARDTWPRRPLLN